MNCPIPFFESSSSRSIIAVKNTLLQGPGFTTKSKTNSIPCRIEIVSVSRKQQPSVFAPSKRDVRTVSVRRMTKDWTSLFHPLDLGTTLTINTTNGSRRPMPFMRTYIHALATRAIGVSQTACEDEFRKKKKKNRSHSTACTRSALIFISSNDKIVSVG